MTNENNSIHRVKINISTNQKKVNLETLLRKLFVNKIQPYIIKKIDGIDKDINLSIHALEIDLAHIEVADIASITTQEEDKIISYFKKEFDIKINALLNSKSTIKVSNKPLKIIQRALNNGFISGFKLEDKDKYNLTTLIGDLSKKDTNSLHSFLLKNFGNKNLIHRFFQQLNKIEIDQFYNKIDVNYLLIYNQLKTIFKTNKVYFKHSNIEWGKKLHHYLLFHQPSSINKIDNIVNRFIESAFSINIKLLNKLKSYEKLLSVSSIKQREQYFLKEIKSYDKLINKLSIYFEKEKERITISKKELIFLFQNFLLENHMKSNTDDQFIQLFIKSLFSITFLEKSTIFFSKSEPYSSENFSETYLNIESKIYWAELLIKTGSLPPGITSPSKQFVLNSFMLYAKERPFETRQLLFDKKKRAPWQLIDLLNEVQLEQVIHFLSPNFLFEKKRLFSFLEVSKEEKFITFSNIKQLRKEFNRYALQRLIFRKEIHFKIPKNLFNDWVLDNKIKKGASYKIKKQSNNLKYQYSSQILSALDLSKTKEKRTSELISNKNEVNSKKILEQFNAAFFENILSHYIFHNELPWWGEMQLGNYKGKQNQLVKELITQFKKQFYPEYKKFLNLIKNNNILLEVLVYKASSNIFNFLLPDFITVKNAVQIKLFLEDLNIISTSLLEQKIYKKLTLKNIFYNLINKDSQQIIDKYFDLILGTFLSNAKIDLEKSVIKIASLSFASEYFSSIDLYKRFKAATDLIQKQEKLDEFQVDWTFYNQLIEELHAYFKTGILEGALSLNKVTYFEFISDLLEDKRQKELLINSLKESKFPSRYFSFSSSFPEDKLLKNEEKSTSRNKEESKDDLKQNFNETQQEPDFEDLEEKLDQTIKYNLTREQFVFTAFDLNDILDLKKEDLKKEEKLLQELSYFKNSINLNLAIFKYLIYNNDLPWWSPFETIFEFQLQFIIVYKENRNSLFKELSIFFSKDKARTKITGYFNYKLNQPLGTQQLLSTTVKELNKIISIETSQNLYSQLLNLELLSYSDFSAKEQENIIKGFLKFAITYSSWESPSGLKRFINLIQGLIEEINKNFNINIDFEAIKNNTEQRPSKRAKSNNKIIGKKLRELDQQFSQKTFALQELKQTTQEAIPELIFWSFKGFSKFSEYNFLQNIILSIKRSLSSISDSKSFQIQYNSQLTKLIYRLWIESGTYTAKQLTDELLAKVELGKSINKEIVSQVDTQLENLKIDNENKVSIINPIIYELFDILKEKYPKKANIYIQEINALAAIQDEITKKELGTTILGILYYLSIETKKELEPLLLSFFRLNTLQNTSLYNVLLNLNKDEKIDEFEKEQADLVIKIELNFFIKKLEMPKLVTQSVLFVSDIFKELDPKKWTTNFILYMVKQHAKWRNVSLTIAFDEINEKIIKDKEFSALSNVKNLLSNFEKNEYFLLEEDIYSNIIKERKSLENISQIPEDIVNELIKKMMFNDYFLEGFKTLDKKGNLPTEEGNLVFPREQVLPEIKKGEQLYIYNAGLALIWPFVATLFTKLGYIKDKQFINKPNQFRAVHLLQYIIDGGDTSPEFILVLNKLICGIPLSDPLDMFVTLTEKEKKEADQFLKSIKNKWKEMKNTSLATFRDSFLKREGTLTFDEKNWKLKVESKPIDVLLRKLPWGFSLIKFHWIDYIIFVEWTTKN